MGENWKKDVNYLGLLLCKFVHLDICWSVCKMDGSERYLWHFCILLVFPILTLLGGTSMIQEVN